MRMAKRIKAAGGCSLTSGTEISPAFELGFRVWGWALGFSAVGI